MRISLIIFSIFLVFFILSIGLVIIIGMYVYKDSKKRGMDPVLWTIVAVIAPSMLGFLVYLIVISSQNKKVECTRCNTYIDNSFSICPYCGTNIISKQICTHCSKKVEDNWKVCPYCSNSLNNTIAVASSSRKVDKELKLIIILFACIFCLLIFVGISFMTFRIMM